MFSVEPDPNLLSPFIANYALKELGDFGRVLFAAGTGVAQNPMLEVLYAVVSF